MQKNLISVSYENIGRSYFFVIGAFVELFTVMICLRLFLVAMYSKNETGNLLYIRCYIGNGKIATS